MAKHLAITPGVLSLVQRHAAVEGTKTGAAAFESLKNISNADPNEAIWNKGDKFTVPAADELDKAVFVAKLGDANVPAIAVQLVGSDDAKVLYLSALRKRVIQYEEKDGEFVPVRNSEGAPVVHQTTNTALLNDIMKQPTAAAIASFIAGKTFEVQDVIAGIQTSRIGTKKDEYGNETRGVVGLRKTSIPVFVEV